MKHTPGPWRAICKKNERPFVIVDDRPFRHESIFMPVAPKEEQDANARLIAAAPELLEAAKEAIGVMIAYQTKCEHKISSHQYANAIEILQRAVAKAQEYSHPMTKREEAEEAAIRG